MNRNFVYLSLPYLLLVSTLLAPHVTGLVAHIPAELQRLYTGELDDWKPPKKFRDAFPYYLCGEDEENHPIWVIEIGKWDIRSTIEDGLESTKTFDKYVDQAVLFIYNSSLSDDGVHGVTGIIDFDGYNLSQLTSPKTITYIVQKLRFIFLALTNLQSAYIINANFFAERILNVVRPILGQEFEKFEIHGTNAAKWKPRILKTIPREKLPSWYGGLDSFKPVKIFG